MSFWFNTYFSLDRLPPNWLPVFSQHDIGFVLLSFAPMVLAAYIAFAQIWLMREASNRQQHVNGWLWWLMASMTLACGIFSLHFIAMLGFEVPTEMHYDLEMTMLSGLLAWLGCALGLWPLRQAQVGRYPLLGGGLAMGLAVAGMHFVGMAGFHGPLGLRFEPGVWLLAVLIALAVGPLALTLYARFSDQWGHWPASRFMALSLVLGLGVAAMHYTGMAAAQFYSGGECSTALPGFDVDLDPGQLRLVVVLVTGSLMSLMLALAHTSSQRASLLQAKLQETKSMLQQEQKRERAVSEFSEKLQKESAEKNWLLNILNASTIVSVTDARGMIVHASEAFCKISGYSKDELLGNTHRIINAGADGVTDWGEVWHTIQNGETWKGLVCNRKKDGSLYWVKSAISPYFDDDRVIQHYVSVRFEVTAVHALQQEVQHLHHIFSGAINAIDEAFFIFDPEDRLVFYNEKYLQTCKFSQGADISGTTFEEIIRYAAEQGQYPEAVGRVEEWVQERLGLHRQAHSEHLQLHLDGHVFKISETQTALGYTVGFLVDVTELYRAQEQATQASRTKSEFLANMSHEIRTPMHAVMGMLNLLQKTSLSTQQQDYAGKASTAARSLLSLLNDILDVSRMDAGRLQLEQKSFELADELQELRAILMGIAKSDEVDIVLDIAPQAMGCYVGDRLRLHQVLINLIGNALKFTQRGVVCLRITVQHEEAQQRVLRFEVADTGMGIAQAFQEQIFNAFVQADASISRQYGGTGLGLKISHDLVALMGGHLGFTSTEGQGTCFFFELRLPYQAITPTASPAPAPSPVLLSTEEALPLTGLCILLAEDNVVNQQVAAEVLAADGAEVAIADNGQIAIDMLYAQPDRYDLVLMDMQMPLVDGISATRTIRTDPRFHALPIIAMTANASAQDREACLQAGMNDHVAKPLEWDDLTELILVHTQQRSAPGCAKDSTAPV